MDVLDMFKPNPPDGFLYHYTSQRSFKSIVEDRAIWATNILYLNDGAEFFYTVDLFANGVETIYYNDEDLTKEEKGFLIEVRNVIIGLKDSKEAKEVYACSFSSEPDQLSQWRGYCPGGNGYSIGFDFNNKMMRHIRKQGFDLAQCIYVDKDEFPQPVQNFLSETLKTFNRISNKNELNARSVLEIFGFTEKFLKIAPRIKNSSFNEEKEWRLIANISDNKKIRFREGRSMIIPYTEIQFEEDGGINIPEIWIGPTSHPELARNATSKFLQKENCYAYNDQISHLFPDELHENLAKKKIEPSVKMSESSYRTW